MTTTFFKNGNTYRVSPGDSVNVGFELPPGNYVLKNEPFVGFFLEIAEPFTMPSKIYGNCLKNCERILNTYRDRGRNTGVLLVGEKGSGKTLLSRQIAISSNLPVIIINSAFTGDDFNSFLNAITQPTIVFFDEFEKIYKRDDQEQVLTLLDGTYQSNKLFLFTANDEYALDRNLQNRPGRIYYLLNFETLEQELIREFCEDNLKDKSKIERVIKTSLLFDAFNFDMLSSIVEEVNRYGEDPMQLLDLLNTRPEYGKLMEYSIVLQMGDKIIPPHALDRKTISVNVNTSYFELGFYLHWDDDKDKGNKIYSEIYQDNGENVTSDQLTEWLEQGIVFFGKEPTTTGNDNTQQYTNGLFELDFAPEDIIRYEGFNSTVFKHERTGITATLTRAPSRKRLKRA